MPDVAISRRARKPNGIATPVCALVRNDVEFLERGNYYERFATALHR